VARPFLSVAHNKNNSSPSECQGCQTYTRRTYTRRNFLLKQPPPRTIHLPADVGYYAPATRTTLNHVFLSPCLSVDSAHRLVLPRVLPHWEQAGALRHPAMGTLEIPRQLSLALHTWSQRIEWKFRMVALFRLSSKFEDSLVPMHCTPPIFLSVREADKPRQYDIGALSRKRMGAATLLTSHTGFLLLDHSTLAIA